jgi:hypothetical protein
MGLRPAIRLAFAAAALVSLGSLQPGAAYAQLFGGTQEKKPKMTDAEAQDAVDLFSRLCFSTRGDRARTASIIETGGSAVEPLDDKLLPTLHGGKPGGVGWKIRMPLGEDLVVDFPPDGTCIVRAPKVDADALEADLAELLDQISASGAFKVRYQGDETKTVDNMKYRFSTYTVGLPDTGNRAIVLMAATDSKEVLLQGSLSFKIEAAKPQGSQPGDQ